MLTAVLGDAATSEIDAPAQSLGAAVTDLFEEARRRRRRRFLIITAFVSVGLAVAGGLLIAGGAGQRFGGPPTHSNSRGPTGGTATHAPPPAARPLIPKRQPFCGSGAVFLVPHASATSASLLPCYAVRLPTDISTTPTP